MSGDLLACIKADLQQECLSTEDLASRYGVSQRTILRYLDKINGICREKNGRRIRYHIYHKRSSKANPVGNTSTYSRQKSKSYKSDFNENKGQCAVLSTDTSDDNTRHQRHCQTSKETSNRTDEKKWRPSSYGNLLHQPEIPGYTVDQLAAVQPLTYLELDTIRFGIIHQKFRNFLYEQAQRRSWRICQTKRDIWLEPQYSARPFKIQLGNDSIYFICSDPGFDTEWLVDYIGECCDTFPGIEQILREIARPVVRYCELALMIMDLNVITPVDIVLKQYYGKDGVLMFPPPNPITPGLKVYHPSGVLRMEFLANQSQKSSLVQIMQSLTAAISTASEIRKKLPAFIDTYYPLQSDAGTKICDLVHSAVRRTMKQLKKQNSLLHPELEGLYKRKEHFFDEYDTVAKNDIYRELDHFKAVTKIFTKAFTCSDSEASVFLAMVALFFSKRSKPVSIIEVSGFLILKMGISMDRDTIKKCRDNLISIGLLAYQPPYDFYFSRVGQLLFQEMKAYRLKKT